MVLVSTTLALQRLLCFVESPCFFLLSESPAISLQWFKPIIRKIMKDSVQGSPELRLNSRLRVVLRKMLRFLSSL